MPDASPDLQAGGIETACLSVVVDLGTHLSEVCQVAGGPLFVPERGVDGQALFEHRPSLQVAARFPGHQPEVVERVAMPVASSIWRNPASPFAQSPAASESSPRSQAITPSEFRALASPRRSPGNTALTEVLRRRGRRMLHSHPRRWPGFPPIAATRRVASDRGQPHPPPALAHLRPSAKCPRIYQNQPSARASRKTAVLFVLLPRPLERCPQVVVLEAERT